MKRPARPLFSILLLALLAVALTCRTALLRRGGGVSGGGRVGAGGVVGGPFELEGAAQSVMRGAPLPDLNSSMLRYAEIDASEEWLKKETEQLLEGDLASSGRFRTYGTWRRFNHHDPKARNSRGMPATLRSPMFYRYWLDFRRNLRDWARSKRFQPDVMDDLVRLVKHPLDRHAGLPASDRRYASCAVVGNSGILLQSGHGELIDSHEAVIRLNNARIENFGRDVGSKTTVSFVNSNILHFCARREGCFCHPYGPSVPMAMYICQPAHFLDYIMCNASHKAPLIVTDPRFDVLCARIVKSYSLRRFVAETGRPLEAWDAAHDAANFHYSSGMQAVMLAAGICDRVSLFGFGKSAAAKHHYYTNQKSELGLHHYEAEYDLYRDLAQQPRAIPFVSAKFRFPPVAIYR